MRFSYCCLLAFAAAPWQIVGTFAQTLEEADLALAYGDKATISIATGSKQPVRRAPAVATVITANDIAAMSATDLDEVVEAVPGVHVGRTAVAYGSLYVIRGIFSQFTPQTGRRSRLSACRQHRRLPGNDHRRRSDPQ